MPSPRRRQPRCWQAQARRFVNPGPTTPRRRRRWRGRQPGRVSARVACRHASRCTYLPAARLKAGVGLPSTRNAPSNSRAAGHTGQPGIPGSRAYRAAGHTGQPGIPGSRAYRAAGHTGQPDRRTPDSRAYRAAGQPGIPGSRAYRAAGQPDSRTYRTAGHTGQPGIPDISDRRTFRIPTPAAQHRSQQTPLARPQTRAFFSARPAPQRAPRSTEPASGAAEAGVGRAPQPESTRVERHKMLVLQQLLAKSYQAW